MNNLITSMNKAEINQNNQEKVIDSILEGTERMARIPYVKRLLFCWWKWRNLSRNTLPPQLDLKNDHVDASRSRNDLINAGACDFEMFRLDRIINKRNLSRNTLPPQLDLKNDHVDASRSRNDLINAGACDFEMFRLDRIINKLEPSLKEAVYAFYGHRSLRGVIHAADELGICKRTMIRRLCRIDQAIAEALDELRNKEESC